MKPYGLKRAHSGSQFKSARAREKDASRRLDYEDLEAGRKTVAELRRENTLIRADGAVMQPAKYGWQLW